MHRTDIMEGFRRNLRHIARIDAIIAGLLINALFTGIAIDLMLSHGQNENNMKELVAVCDAYTHNPGDENCERLTFVAREHGKSAQNGYHGRIPEKPETHRAD